MPTRFVLPYADIGAGIQPSSGALLYFYETGTTTLKDTYSDSAATTPNANPVVANSVGVFGDIWLSGTYKVVLRDSTGSTRWEADPILDEVSALKAELIATNGSSLITHTHSAIDYNLAAYLSNRYVVNAADYGVSTSGTGTENQAALQLALNTGLNVKLPEGVIEVDGAGVKFTTTRQVLLGHGYSSAINYTGAGTAIDFDGWAGCAVEDLLVYSATAAVGINIQPNAGSTRFAHWWRLNRVMVVGTTPNWGSTALGSAIEGFSTAGIRVQRSYYGAAYNCEASWVDGSGFLGLNEHNANMYYGCQTRNCNIGVNWGGANASNGSSWIGGAVENSVGTETAGIFVGESDRNNFLGVRMECSYGTHIIVNPPTGIAQENQFIGCIMGGTAASMTLGDATGTSIVRGTFVSGGKMSGALVVNSDCTQTHIEMSGTSASGIAVTDNGYGTIMHLDPTSTGRYYERATTANTSATSVETTIAGGSVEKDYNDSYLNMSFSNLANAFRFENVNAGGTELAIFRMGAYRLWVNPADGKLYLSGATPTSGTDGTVVGAQT